MIGCPMNPVDPAQRFAQGIDHFAAGGAGIFRKLPLQKLCSCMTHKQIIQGLAAFLVFAIPPCGFLVVTSLQERARVEAIPPAQLPGHVVVYSCQS